MDISDLFITPFYIILVYLVAYWIRPKVTNEITRRYFIPGLTLKIFGGLAFGLIYQFYYKGGDTFEYFRHVKILLGILNEYPFAGIKLLMERGGEYNPSTFNYASRLYWYTAPTEYFVIRVATFLGIFTLGSYASITVFFAALSFTGIWAMYITFLKLYPGLHKQFAIATLFFPSLFFWGSGLMKDPICIGALGWLFWGFYKAFIEKRGIILSLLIVILAAYVIKITKSYILLSFLPPALFWIFNENSQKIKNKFLRWIIKPVLLTTGVAMSIWGISFASNDSRININTIPEIARINADYLYGVSVQQGGSAYKIGELDGTYSSMIKVAPKAINVSLFRPYIWEVRNPVMLLSAIEASIFIYMTIFLFMRIGFLKSLRLIGSKPILTFCFIFSIVFAFGVGINSNNFGSLVRYKIPLIPFYTAALFIMYNYYKNDTFLKRRQ